MELVLEALRQLYEAAIIVPDSALHGVKTVFYGDPVEVAESDLPALIVRPGVTDYNHQKSGTRYDRKVHAVDTVLLFSKSQYMSKHPTDARKVKGVYEAVRMAEKVDTSGKTAATSVCGVIQGNPSLPYRDESNVLRQAAISGLVQNVRYEFTTNRNAPIFEVVVSSLFEVQGDRR